MSFQQTPQFALKDVFTLVFSALALIVSLFGYFQKKGESTQSQRKRLSDVMKEITELTLKDATYRSLNSEKKKEYPENYSGLLSDQRRFFAREAGALSDALGDLVSSHENNLIAAAFDSLDYVEEADRFYKTATQTTKSQVELGLSWRNYGRFLYKKGAVAEGRAAYLNALEAFKGDDDRNRFYRSTTYIRWSEAVILEQDDVDELRSLYEKAKAEAASIHNPRRREHELERVEIGFGRQPSHRDS